MASIPADRMIVPPQSPEQTKSGTSKKRRPVGSGPLPPALPPICKIFKKKTEFSQEIFTGNFIFSKNLNVLPEPKWSTQPIRLWGNPNTLTTFFCIQWSPASGATTDSKIRLVANTTKHLRDQMINLQHPDAVSVLLDGQVDRWQAKANKSAIKWRLNPLASINEST